MRSLWVRAIALLLVLLVVYVLISPFFTLDPTANRAWLAALQVMTAMAVTATALAGLQKLAFCRVPGGLSQDRLVRAPSLAILCIHLC